MSSVRSPCVSEEALEAEIEGSPSIKLEYDEAGNVIGTFLEESSGNEAIDRAALEAARNYKMMAAVREDRSQLRLIL